MFYLIIKFFRPLVFLGMNLLLHFDVHKTLGCDEKTLYNWLTVIERHYHVTNTYHNSSHAADVLQATACFLERERIKRLLDELDEACCLIAAACHDIDHPGKSRWSSRCSIEISSILIKAKHKTFYGISICITRPPCTFCAPTSRLMPSPLPPHPPVIAATIITVATPLTSYWKGAPGSCRSN